MKLYDRMKALNLKKEGPLTWESHFDEELGHVGHWEKAARNGDS